MIRDWEQLEFVLASNVSNLSWCYIKNASVSTEDDSGWLDALSFEGYQERLCEALDMSTENCALIDSVAADPLAAPWLVASIATVGDTSLRSFDINDNQQSCLVLGLSLPANSVISLASRISSEGGMDQLQISADNLRLDTISAAIGTTEKPWAHATYYLPIAATELRWCYVKDGGNSEGDDSAWIDNLSFSTSDISYQSRICAALDLAEAICSMVTSIDYNPNEKLWVITSQTSVSGGTSLRSPDIDDDQFQCLELTIQLPANSLVRFSLRTDSEAVNDFLFYEVGTSQGSSINLLDNFSAANGSLRDWEPQEFMLQNSIRVMFWCYTKNSSTSIGADSGWIDALDFTLPLSSISEVCDALDMSTDDCALITDVSITPPEDLVLPTRNGTPMLTLVPWLVSPVATEGTSSLRSGNIVNNQASCLVLGVTLQAYTRIRFSLRTSLQGFNDRLAFFIDSQVLIESFSAPEGSTFRDWEQQEFFPSGTNLDLTWCYLKDSDFSEGEDSGWLDALDFTAPLPISQICTVLDMSTEDCALITRVTSEPPDVPLLVASTATGGGTSLRSSDIDDSQQSCLVLSLSLPANSVISLASRTSSEGGMDQLQISADNLRLDTISAAVGDVERPWRQTRYFLPADISTLSWCYVKDGDNSEGDDSAWIDNLSFSTSDIPYQSRICSALDITADDCSLIQSVAYSPPELLWVITSETSVAGGSSLRSAYIANNRSTCLVLQTTLPASTRINFSWRIDAAGGQDFLNFIVGQNTVAFNFFSAPPGSSLRDWEQSGFYLSDSNLDLTWCYTKKINMPRGENSGWVDELVFTAPLSVISEVCDVLDMSADDCALITGVSTMPPEDLVLPTRDGTPILTLVPWFVSPVATEGTSSLRSGNIIHNQASCLVLGVTLQAYTRIRFSLRANFEGFNDRLAFFIDNQVLIESFSADIQSVFRDWEQQAFIPSGTNLDLTWCYLKNRSTDQGEDRGWLDALDFTAPLTISEVCAALDMSTENCALITGVASEPPDVPWLPVSTATVGGTSLRNVDIDDSQQSCLVLSLSLPANSVISLASRISSEGGMDQLQIFADNLRLDTISAATGDVERPWHQTRYFLPADISTLSWCYVKDGGNSEGNDSAWLDNVSFSTSDIPYQSRICSALDITADDCSLIQSVAYNPPELLWVVTPETSVAGGSSLRSPDIGNNQRSCLVLDLSLPVNSVITAAGRTSSEGGRDQLQISADNLRLDTISAAIGDSERPWHQTSYFLPADSSELSWCYVKNGGNSEGDDRVWIDNVSFSTSDISYQSRICSALDIAANDCSLIRSITYDPPELLWVVTSETSVVGGTSLRSPDLDDGQRSCLILGGALSVDTRVIFSHQHNVEIDSFVLLLLIGPLSASIQSNSVEWRESSTRLPLDISDPSWCYTKDSANSVGTENIWIDAVNFIVPEQLTLCDTLDMSIAECALIDSISAEPPASPWLDSTTATEGGTSLRSASIGDDQQSCLIFGVALRDSQNVVQFSRRVSSQPGADVLSFTVDGQRPFYRLGSAANTVLRDWSREVYFVAGDITTLRWCYAKDGDTSEGEDGAWLDDMSIAAAAAAPLTRELVCLVLDMSSEDCTLITGVTSDPSTRPWSVSAVSRRGDTALRSANSSDDSISCLVLDAAVPGNHVISFSLRTDRTATEGTSDSLTFSANGQQLIGNFAALEGETLRDWVSREFVLSSSVNSLMWCHNAQSLAASGSWLDALTFTGPEQRSLCDTLDLPLSHCGLIRSATFDPPQNPWLTTTTEFVQGDSALVSPPLAAGDSSCLILEFSGALPAGSYLAFDWRVTSASAQDIFELQAGNRQRQIANAPEWQTESIAIDSAETTLSWCYRPDSPADRQTARAWLDNLLLVTPADRYRVEIAVTSTPIQTLAQPDIRFQVTITAQSLLLPTPSDWVLIVSGIDNISGADSTYGLVFNNDVAQVDVSTTADNPLLPSSILLALDDRPLLRAVTVTSLTVQLPATVRLEQLMLSAAADVAQTAVDAAIEVTVTVIASDNFDRPLDLTGVSLMVEDAGNARVLQSSYALTFTNGLAQTTITVELTNRGEAGSIELSVIRGNIQSIVRVTLDPVPRVLVSVTLSAADSSLVQTMANTPVMTELILTTLDNYGDPLNVGDISLQLSDSSTMLQSSLTVPIETSGTARQLLEIDLPNDLDTTVTVQILRGTLDPTVQLLPDEGIQITVRARRVLRQLQLSLVGAQSPLQQIDQTVPIRANIRLIGLDQYDQPSAFSEVMLTATAEPTATRVMLNPQRVAATAPEGALTVMEVMFPEFQDTMITIAIADPGTGVTANELVLQALPDRRPPLRPLHVDDTDTSVTELDLIVAMRWLTDQQSSTESLVVNLTITSANITADSIDNLRQLTNSANLNRVDVNGDGRIDQLDLRILLRYISGLRGAQLAEQGFSVDIIRLLLDQQ